MNTLFSICRRLTYAGALIGLLAHPVRGRAQEAGSSTDSVPHAAEPASVVTSPQAAHKQDIPEPAIERTSHPLGLQLDLFSYTFLYDHATNSSGMSRPVTTYGRLDFGASWTAYRSARTRGSVHLLLRSGVDIGVNGAYNWNTDLGSKLFPECLQAGAPTNLGVYNLYYEQDLFSDKLKFFVGRVHPNQHINLSYLNNDETIQFMAGSTDGNIANPYVGAFADGAAVEYKPSSHVFLHAIAINTEGKAWLGPQTIADGKLYETAELGWQSGSYGHSLHSYRLAGWRDDTQTNGSGHGGTLEFDHELPSGWAAFGRFGAGTAKGSSIKQDEVIGLTHTHPFGRRNDMFGVSETWSQISATNTSHRKEQLFEAFYRARIHKVLEIGPDVQVLGHPATNPDIAHKVLVGVRLRIVVK